MARYSISQAKNLVSRCLRNIIDPVPTTQERKSVWDHFDNQCAYCGMEMSPTARVGHLDHVVPVSEGGSNHVSNFVLSCPGCNGDEKRELDWEIFLRNSAGSEFELRCARIQAWLDQGTDDQRQLTEIELAVLNRVTGEVKDAISKAADELRALRG